MKTKKIISFIVVLLWMGTVFYFSHQPGVGSSNTSKTVATKIVQIIDYKEKMGQEQRNEMINKVDPYLRKIAHYSIYLVGGFIIANAMRNKTTKEGKLILSAGAIGVMYAITDEIHQLYIAGRSGRLVDILIDSLGVFTGVVLFLILSILVQRIKNRKMKTKGEK